MNPAVTYLPQAMVRAAPELTALALPDETRSDCANCALAGNPFLADVKCCTYHPSLPNYLVGRALLRGDAGTEAVRARLKNHDGVDVGGIGPPAEWTQRYKKTRHLKFGRERSWTCPYWIPGQLNCSIWRDRTAVCRTWHCRHVDAAKGYRLWRAARRLIEKLEHNLATLAMKAVPFGGDWEAYFINTAHFVQAIETLDDDEGIAGLRSELTETLAAAVELPAVLAPLVRDVQEDADQVVITGYSPWNPERFPRTVFTLLAACDGTRTWAEALEIAQQTAPEIDKTWVVRLFLIDALSEASAGSTWGFEGADLDPSALG